MTACIFLGPTLPVAEAKAILPGIYLPPVRQGDVYRAVHHYRPSAIGIIDGYFHQVPSVWHKEILCALAEGVQVFGSASMGALRAAELNPFGLEGVGRVFEAFRDRTLEDDDEVAVIHGPEELGFVAASEAMVNIRWTLDAAAEEGIIKPSTAARLTALAKALFYPKRTYPEMLKRARTAGLPDGELAAFATWLENGRIDAKRDDALAMLQRMAEVLSESPPAKPVNFNFEHTTLWEAAISAIRASDASADDIVDARIDIDLMDELCLDGAYDDLRQAALLRLLALDEANRQGLRLDDDDVREAIAAFRIERGLHRGADLRAWLEARDLTRDDLYHLVEDNLLLDKVLNGLSKRAAGFAIDELRLKGDCRELIERARAKRNILGDCDDDRETADSTHALAWYFQNRRVASPHDLDAFARQRGFEDGHDFRRAVTRDYHYRQIADEAVLDEG